MYIQHLPYPELFSQDLNLAFPPPAAVRWPSTYLPCLYLSTIAVGREFSSPLNSMDWISCVLYCTIQKDMAEKLEYRRRRVGFYQSSLVSKAPTCAGVLASRA